VCSKVTEVTEEHATVVRNWTQKRPHNLPVNFKRTKQIRMGPA
jgi:hypothetical protein